MRAKKEQAFTIDEVFPDRAGFSALRAYRTLEDMTQHQLAEKVGISRRYISEMETGKRVIDEEVAQRLAEALGVDYRALL